MSCNCCPPVIVSSGTSTPPGPPCLSADAGNTITLGSDGCLYAPAAPSTLTLDPAECNAAQTTADGLLVPRTELVGVPADTPEPISDERSVQIDVAHTEGCPDTWAVGARLAAPSGFKNAEGQHADLLAAVGADVPVPASDIVLPEAGVYHLDADVRYALGTTGGSGYMIGWLRDETTGTLLTSFTQIAAINSPAGPEHQGGTTHLMTEYRVDSGPRTVRLHLMAVQTGGALTAAEAGGTDSNGATRMRYLKVRD